MTNKANSADHLLTSTHTPGPWRHGLLDTDGSCISSPQFIRGQYFGRAVFSQEHDVVALVPHDTPDDNQDARLIAQAPTLLAHLEWAAKFLQPLIGGSAQYDAILATIASARGDV